MPTKSYWRATTSSPRFPRLGDDLTVDAIVVGGGNTGVNAAYLMKQAGLSVALLERDRCGYGDTANTSAHLTYVTDHRISKLVSQLGRDHAQAVWDAGDAAIQHIEETVRRESIDCNFANVPGYLFAAIDGEKDERDELRKEAELAGDIGYSATYVDAVPLFNRPGIRFPNQARFHPLKYLRHLVERIPGDGCHVFEHTEVQEINGDPPVVKANGKSVSAKFVFIATDVPLQGKTGLISATLFQTKIMPYTSYVVGAKLPKDTLPDALLFDTSDPYHFFRIDRRPRNDYAIFGGLDHKTGQEEDGAARFTQLEKILLQCLPDAKVDHRWSGQVIEAVDGLPYIGETAAKQFVAAGFSGNGLTFGTVAAMMACDAALGRANPWSDLFNPNRKKLSALWNYLRENVDYPYYMIKDRLVRSEGDKPGDVKPGEGRVLKIDGQRMAIHRDKAGTVNALNPVCTHMGCIVHWNNAEDTWDCPCHGSRFSPAGDVLAGPAETPMDRLSLPTTPA